MSRIESSGTSTVQSFPIAPDGAYTVESGDSLSGIAAQIGIPTEELIAVNPQITDPNLIEVGQEIHLPSARSETKAASDAPAQPLLSDSSAVATETRGFLDMGADLLRRSLDASMNAGEAVHDAGKQMLDNILGGQPAGSASGRVAIAPGTPTAPAEPPAPASSPADARAKSLANDITGVFETGKVGGDPSMVQNKDAGIISYGKHQCTLSSKEDSLEKVLDRYRELAPDSDSAKKLDGFMDRVRKKDPTLRNDQEFISLLEEAGKDPVMSQAQDQVFDEMYWNPAMDSARKAGVESPLGKALLYDTAVNSGPDNLNKIIAATQKKLAGKDYTEEEFLKAFSEERKDFILDAANGYRAKGGRSDCRHAGSRCKRLAHGLLEQMA